MAYFKSNFENLKGSEKYVHFSMQLMNFMPFFNFYNGSMSYNYWVSIYLNFAKK